MGTRRRSLLFLGVVCPLAVVAGCRCSSPPRAQTDAAAATPTAVPASTPPARGPASNPVASQASDEAMIAQYRERLNGLARGRTDVGSLWGDASSFAAARARRLRDPAKTGEVEAAVRRRFEFLVACRAVRSGNPATCAETAALGEKSRAWCEGQAALVRSLQAALREGSCEAGAVAAGAKHLGLPSAEFGQLCGALARRQPEKCPERASFVRQCRAFAAGDPLKCKGPTGQPSTGRFVPEADCRADFAALEALRAGDATRLRGGSDLAAYAAAALRGTPSCEEHFVESFTREVAVDR